MATILDFAATYGHRSRPALPKRRKHRLQLYSGLGARTFLHPCRGLAISAPPIATIRDFAATYGHRSRPALPRRRKHRSQLDSGLAARAFLLPSQLMAIS